MEEAPAASAEERENLSYALLMEDEEPAWRPALWRREENLSSVS